MFMREYETIYILRPDMGEDAQHAVTARVRGVIAAQKGILLYEHLWGKRKLAYEIDKHLKGVYFYLRYLGDPGLTLELERNFKMIESVVKYLTVKIDDRVDVDKRVEEAKAEASDPNRNKPPGELIEESEEAAELRRATARADAAADRGKAKPEASSKDDDDDEDDDDLDDDDAAEEDGDADDDK